VFCPVCRADYPADWKRCPKDEAVLLRSQAIGKYRIEGLLGVGGMGAVYRAVNPDTKASVAIKVMNAALENSEAARARFVREAAAVGALRTAHVAAIYDFGSEADGAMYLVMEFLAGHGLRTEIAAGENAIPLPRFAMILDGALRGLSAAHRAGIVHRDLKPENIFIASNDDGEVPKLLDFGIARVKTRESDLTHSGAIMGTPGYMAPEQVSGERGNIGPWTDTYAMGVIGYEMLTGVAPFAGDTMSEILMRIVERRFTPLPDIRPGLPAELYGLIDQCLQTDASKRPPNADAMRELLRSIGLLTTGSMQVPKFVPPAKKVVGSGAAGALDTLDADAAGTAATVTPAPVTPARLGAAPAIAPVSPTIPVTVKPAAQAPAPVPKARRTGAFVAAGVALLTCGAGVLLWQRARSSPSSSSDARLVATLPDAVPVAADAAAPTSPDASEKALPAELAAFAQGDWRRTWQVFAAGEYTIGQAGIKGVPGLARAVVDVKSFAIMPTELTRQRLLQSASLDGETRTALQGPALTVNDAPDAPIRGFTAAQAEAACASLGARLPTELEWEVAARTTPNDPKRAVLLNQLTPDQPDCSTLGLCNMLGSLAEWTSTAWPGTPSARVVRGASVSVGAGAGWYASIHARTKVPATSADIEVGFRCVLPLSSSGS